MLFRRGRSHTLGSFRLHSLGRALGHFLSGLLLDRLADWLDDRLLNLGSSGRLGYLHLPPLLRREARLLLSLLRQFGLSTNAGKVLLRLLLRLLLLGGSLSCSVPLSHLFHFLLSLCRLKMGV